MGSARVPLPIASSVAAAYSRLRPDPEVHVRKVVERLDACRVARRHDGAQEGAVRREDDRGLENALGARVPRGASAPRGGEDVRGDCPVEDGRRQLLGAPEAEVGLRRELPEDVLNGGVSRSSSASTSVALVSSLALVPLHEAAGRPVARRVSAASLTANPNQRHRIARNHVLPPGAARGSRLRLLRRRGRWERRSDRPEVGRLGLPAARREHGFAIAHVLETHDHADHVSGKAWRRRRGRPSTSRPRQASSSRTSRWPTGTRCGSGRSRSPRSPRRATDPEHTAYLIADKSRGAEPWLVVTGDSLFVGDVARPDLAVDKEEGARGLYASVQRLLALATARRCGPGTWAARSAAAPA